mmetsp:Transcript_38749/g.96032  ORF Transcript_38749/g.96032 Transcript_38749/m.96032 type:complete len:276 (+) Transcript_38749:68-895(+)
MHILQILILEVSRNPMRQAPLAPRRRAREWLVRHDAECLGVPELEHVDLQQHGAHGGQRRRRAEAVGVGAVCGWGARLRLSVFSPQHGRSLGLTQPPLLRPQPLERAGERDCAWPARPFRRGVALGRARRRQLRGQARCEQLELGQGNLYSKGLGVGEGLTRATPATATATFPSAASALALARIGGDSGSSGSGLIARCSRHNSGSGSGGSSGGGCVWRLRRRNHVIFKVFGGEQHWCARGSARQLLMCLLCLLLCMLCRMLCRLCRMLCLLQPR